MEMKVATTKEEVIEALKDGRKVLLTGDFGRVYDCVLSKDRENVIASRDGFGSGPLPLGTFPLKSRLSNELFLIEGPHLSGKEEEIYQQLLALTGDS